MKKLLFALLAFITLAVAAPVAEAGQYARGYSKHGPVYLHKSQLYGGNHYYNGGRRNYHRGYSKHHRSVLRSPYYRSNYSRSHYSRSHYSRPVYYSRSNYSNCRPNYGYRSSPRFSVSFGF